MWAVIVTNQGVPLEIVLVQKKEDLVSVENRVRSEWGCTYRAEFNVLARPLFHQTSNGMSASASTPVTKISGWADSEKNPRYITSSHRVDASNPKLVGATTWKFCPECGCPWIHHLSGQSNLEPEDWEPCPCTECGCEKAIKP